MAELNLPNGLTILRIFFVPLLVVVLLTREPNLTLFGFPFHFEMWGVLILLMAASTDVADGYLARKRREVTTLGILLDPIADKLLISAAFISLVEMGLAPAWMVVIIIGRDFTVMGLRNIAASEGLTIPASALGKTKMVLEVVTVCLLILAAKHPMFKLVGTGLLWLVAFFRNFGMVSGTTFAVILFVAVAGLALISMVVSAVLARDSSAPAGRRPASGCRRYSRHSSQWSTSEPSQRRNSRCSFPNSRTSSPRAGRAGRWKKPWIGSGWSGTA